MPDLSDIIEEAAGNPSSASTPQGSVQARSLAELIEADKYLAAKTAAAAARGARTITFTKLVPPGAQ